MTRKLIKGNEAVIYGALLGGATHFFGYPITPASEIAHAASLLFTRAGRTFIQAESEVSSINMVYGAAAAGARVMTASSGPGISLMAEGISYLAGAELPAVIVDIQRAGPGLGNIWPEQSDYNMAVKGGGHGNYRNIVLAPNSAQEMCDFTYRGFEIAERFRMTVYILSDAYIGQMMEPVSLPEDVKHAKRMDWPVYADSESRKNLITSIFMSPKLQGNHNINLQRKYAEVEQELVDAEEWNTDGAELIVVAFGITSRICLSVVRGLAGDGMSIGLVRPKSLYPFPSERIRRLAEHARGISVMELNNGQMAEDIERICGGKSKITRHNWYGGVIPSTDEIAALLLEDYRGRS